jgi:hypothetical protein
LKLDADKEEDEPEKSMAYVNVRGQDAGCLKWMPPPPKKK